MKIALCYHGIAKGSNFKEGGLPVGYAKEFESIKENLIQVNKNHQFDIFLHSWSIESQYEVISKMNPKSFLFESSKVFKKITFFKYIKEYTKKFLGKSYEFTRLNNIYSRWNSFYKVCNLVKNSNEEYDVIIVTRFDMFLFKPLLLDELSLDKFYSGDWISYKLEDKELLEPEYRKHDVKNLKMFKKGYPFDNEGLQDFFFISSSDYMLNSFSLIFKELKSLIKKYGPSNHLIALGKLEQDKNLNNHERVMVYNQDYFLSRWV